MSHRRHTCMYATLRDDVQRASISTTSEKLAYACWGVGMAYGRVIEGMCNALLDTRAASTWTRGKRALAL